MKHLYSLKKYFVKYKKRFLGGILFVIISNLFSVMAPQLTGHMINKVQQYINPQYIPKPKAYNYFVQQIITLLDGFGGGFLTTMALFSTVIILFALLRGLFMYFMRQTLIVMSRHIEYDQKNDIYRHYQGLNQTFYKKNATGDLMNRISEDVSRVRMFTGPGIMYLINLSSLILLAVYFMVQQNPLLSLIVLSPLPLLAIVMYKVNSIINKRSEKMQAQLSTLTSQAQEAYSGIRIIKAFGQEAAVVKKYDKATNDYKDIVLKLVKVESLYFPIIALMIGVSTIFAIYFGGRQVMNGSNGMEVGTILEFVMYVTLLTFPVSAIGWVASILQRGSSAQKRINEFLDIKLEDKFTTNQQQPLEKGAIVFSNVDFVYSNTGIKALQKLNITIPYGAKVLITGPTGCGKSTIAQLLLKFYTPASGRITINGTDINHIDTDVLRKKIGFVPQDVFLFSETVKGNIAFGMEVPPSFDVIEKAAKYASIHNEIMDFAEGYETMVGERGVTLSGGQKQRISIARGLIKDGDYIILDDCLSALDVKTERTIINYLQRELKDKLSIIISHRVTSYKDADMILVMDDGAIIESGSFATLMAKQGAYYDLYMEQSKMTETETLVNDNGQ